MWRTRLLSVLIGAVILTAAGVAMAALLHFKRTPAEASVEDIEKPMVVEARRVFPESAPVLLTGFGSVEAVHEVALAPEVAGQVVSMHPNLIEGGIVSEGELLFAIDPGRYEAQVEDARAQERIQEVGLDRLKAEWQNDEANLNSLRRKQELARKNYERARELSAEGVGSQAEVDSAEENYVTVKNEVDATSRAVALYPARIRESDAQIEAARANLRLAELELSKTSMRAPFNARVKRCMLERHQLVSAGATVLTLVNDSVLEIAVPLNSQDSRKWLEFRDGVDKSAVWFNDLKPVRCAIRWTEAPANQRWSGTVHRVKSYDPKSHTVTVAVRLDPNATEGGAAAQLPLVEGMFCEVQIPGRNLEGVYAVDSAIVNFDNTLYVAKGDRLETRMVTVARHDGETTYIESGLEPGDVIITTRLVDPLENALLQITRLEEGATS